jgi:hypothetical protein
MSDRVSERTPGSPARVDGSEANGAVTRDRRGSSGPAYLADMGSRPRAWIVLAALAGCLEYSPHQLPTNSDEKDLNRKAVERIVARPVDRLRFAAVGDTQRNFDDAKALVDAINRRDDVQFVIQLGDFTNYALCSSSGR